MRLLLPHFFLLLLTPLLAVQASFGQATGELRGSSTAASFHHIHLNSLDPPMAIDFYTRIFEVTKKTSLAGFGGIRSDNIHLLFTEVDKPPATAPHTAIWHFGWGSTAMEADYQQYRAKGVVFQIPITTLPSGLQFTYLHGPDGALVEINSAQSRAFTHVHLYSEAPLCAAEWYEKHLGAIGESRPAGPCEVPFAPPSEPLGVIRSPITAVSIGGTEVKIYPRQRPGPLVSTRGHTVDHIAVSVPDLTAALARLRRAGVQVLEEPYRFGTDGTRAAMIEGPDSIAIELIEMK